MSLQQSLQQSFFAAGSPCWCCACCAIGAAAGATGAWAAIAAAAITVIMSILLSSNAVVRSLRSAWEEALRFPGEDHGAARRHSAGGVRGRPEAAADRA